MLRKNWLIVALATAGAACSSNSDPVDVSAQLNVSPTSTRERENENESEGVRAHIRVSPTGPLRLVASPTGPVIDYSFSITSRMMVGTLTVTLGTDDRGGGATIATLTARDFVTRGRSVEATVSGALPVGGFGPGDLLYLCVSDPTARATDPRWTCSRGQPVEGVCGFAPRSPTGTDPMSDPTNCGGCGVACRVGEQCVQGLCAPPAPAGR